MKKKSLVIIVISVLFAILVYLNASILSILVRCYQQGVGMPMAAFNNPDAWVTYIILSAISLTLIIAIYITTLVLILKRKK